VAVKPPNAAAAVKASRVLVAVFMRRQMGMAGESTSITQI
jgi:hypothetical protein